MNRAAGTKARLRRVLKRAAPRGDCDAPVACTFRGCTFRGAAHERRRKMCGHMAMTVGRMAAAPVVKTTAMIELSCFKSESP